MKHPIRGQEADRTVALSDWRAKASLVATEATARAAALDHDDAFPSDDIAALHRHGLLHAVFPLDGGGGGLTAPDRARELCGVLAEIGKASLSLGRLYEGHVNAATLVHHYGTPANLDLLRREADEGRLTGVWMAGPPLRLSRDAALPHIVGSKLLTSGAGFVRRPLVAADDVGGSLMLLPDVGAGSRSDTRGWRSRGMRATATGTVDFTGITVTESEIVGRHGDYLRSPLFRGGAWRVIAVQLGGLAAIFEHYRSQLTGSPHADHPVQLARFGDAAIAFETAWLWVHEAAAVANGDGSEPEAIDAYVDLARNAFEAAALKVCAAAQKAIGLKSFLRENPLERLVRDLETYLRQPALDASLLAAARFQLERTDAAAVGADSNETPG